MKAEVDGDVMLSLLTLAFVILGNKNSMKTI